MNKTNKTIISGALFLASSQIFAVDSYDIIDLGNLGTSPGFVFSVNNSDVAVGYSAGPIIETTDNDGNVITALDFEAHGFAFENSVITDLGAIVNASETVDESVVFAINNNNRAVGYSVAQVDKTNSQGDPVTVNVERAVYIDKDIGVFNTVPDFDLADSQNMRALSLNDNNIIVGFGKFNPPDDVDSDGVSSELFFDRGFIYDIDADLLTRIDPLTDDFALTSTVRAVNNAGVVTGWAQKIVDEVNTSNSFYIEPGSPTEIIEMPLFSEGNSFPWAINEAGKIVGKAVNAELTNFEAYVFDIATQEATNLGVLSENDRFSEAFDINNLDQIVGFSLINLFPETLHAFIYEQGVMRDLNDLIDCKVDPNEEPIGSPDWVLHSARSINDSGVIVGNGILNGAERAFMLIPRAGQAVACQPLVVDLEEEGGGGSLPIAFISMLLFGVFGIRRRLK